MNPVTGMSRRTQTLTVPYRSSQQGVALVVSLVLLVAMTIMGIATLSGTRLNEMIASNSQQKSIVFEAAESAIESVSSYDVLFSAITTVATDNNDNPKAVELAESKARLKTRYDVLKDGKGIDISGKLKVQYCGEAQPIGTNLSAVLGDGQISALMVDVNSVVGIANSSANADHLRRVSFLAPQTGRSGACVVR